MLWRDNCNKVTLNPGCEPEGNHDDHNLFDLSR